MQTDRVVLDTNSLLVSLARQGKAYPVWKGFQDGRYILCVSNEIIAEYEEVIAQKTRPEIARNVVDYILQQRNVEMIDPYFHLELITADPDDNKFVDCAFSANATYIVSNDSHYDVLRDIPFPQLLVLKLQTFLERLATDSI
ncbi:MAG: putative toxin-antitoxin system toxin component, PIN family [Prevotella sp.]|nr:putative toxin-antitoxin system toxin component, PIN family [Prevotella sp.]